MFPKLLWALYDRHFVSVFTGKTPRFVTFIKTRAMMRPHVPEKQRALEAYAYMSALYRLTLIMALAPAYYVLYAKPMSPFPTHTRGHARSHEAWC